MYNPFGGNLYKGVDINSINKPVLEDMKDTPIIKNDNIKIEFKTKKKVLILNIDKYSYEKKK